MLVHCRVTPSVKFSPVSSFLPHLPRSEGQEEEDTLGTKLRIVKVLKSHAGLDDSKHDCANPGLTKFRFHFFLTFQLGFHCIFTILQFERRPISNSTT